jgi:hypothetical protein
MMRVPITVEYHDGRREGFFTSPADAVAFERHYDKPVTAIGSGRVEYFWWIAWHSLTRLKRTGLPFEEWLDAVDRVSEDTDEEADVLPLDLEAPTGSSSTLPTSST